ncbi:TetR/AcrR family transcriptional regulator [Acidiphilium sp. AL]|uniref:TetR/AcrR family transcriptional regulator n=1 Tax=Acidiphilium iwatense TaxID=768198 RepID=A0ABS9DT31_9PROT|nr:MULTISPECIES: TetR/AcrR family transcriptional regulator [Acidiphilium]MCF3945893.1 TetR/AcrR family transcriptional regulator [Acidiphilium iwatense]MCU4159226.1 TetR/AcrR family transcriptional regulator [Acidiphilium sp. AL]
MTATRKRTRRNADDAKRVILDAAEARLARSGPGGLRLQDIAADIGLSHPVILHHFGSREGLLNALNARTISQLKSAMHAVLDQATSPRRELIDQVLDNVFSAFDGGLAQRVAWLGADADNPPGSMSRALSDIVDLIHGGRLIYAERVGGALPDPEDSRMLAFMVTTIAMGNAIFGAQLLGTTSPANHTAQLNHFKAWLARNIQFYLQASMIDALPSDLPD